MARRPACREDARASPHSRGPHHIPPTPPLCTPTDPLVDRALQLLAELRERTGETLPLEPAEVDELLAGGYVSALALERAQRRLRARALALTADTAAGQPEPPGELTHVAQRELRLAAWEREMRDLLNVLRRRRAANGRVGEAPADAEQRARLETPASAATQATKPRRSA